MHKLGEKKLIEQIMAQTFLDPVLAVATMPAIMFRIWRFWEIRASLQLQSYAKKNSVLTYPDDERA